jgi:copper(I)-binding protein
MPRALPSFACRFIVVATLPENGSRAMKGSGGASHRRRIGPRCLRAGALALTILVGAAPLAGAVELSAEGRVALHDARGLGPVRRVPLASPAVHHDSAIAAEHRAFRAGSLIVMRAWSRPTLGSSRLTAGYLQIANTGTEPDRLIGGSAGIAEQLEIHAAEVRDGISRMRSLPEGIEIPAGATVDLRPGGRHLMFGELRDAVVAGERFEATLVFEKAGPIVVEFDVQNRSDDEAGETMP